jgi:hypothetical protein
MEEFAGEVLSTSYTASEKDTIPAKHDFVEVEASSKVDALIAKKEAEFNHFLEGINRAQSPKGSSTSDNRSKKTKPIVFKSNHIWMVEDSSMYNKSPYDDDLGLDIELTNSTAVNSEDSM